MRARAARYLLPTAFVALALAAWLFVPRATPRPELASPLVIVLVDASASVRGARPDWVRETREVLAEEARRARTLQAELCVVSFARDVVLRFGPGPAAAFEDVLAGRADAPPFDPALPVETGRGGGSQVPEGASLLVAALRTSRELAFEVPRESVTLLYLGDGQATDGDALGALAELERAGVRLLRRPLAPRRRADLAVVDLELPRSVEVGAPLAGLAGIAYRAAEGSVAPPLHARLVVDVEDETGGRRLYVPLALPDPGLASRTTVRWSVPLDLGAAGMGRTRVSVRAELVSAGGRTGVEESPDPQVQRDAHPQNDLRIASVTGEGTRVIGVVADASNLAFARRTFAPSGISALPGLAFVFVTPDGLGTRLSDCDALIVFDLAESELPVAWLETFVRAGRGLFVTCGWRFLLDWVPGRVSGPERPSLARLLPFEPASSEAPPRDVVLLVDGSGSMEGAPFDMVRTASIALVGAALPGDRLSLRFFTTKLEPETLLRERFDPAGESSEELDGETIARRLLGARVPGGQTLLLRSLRAFAAEHRGSEREALVFLLSDGRERDLWARPDEAARETLGQLAAAGARLFVVAVGDDYDREFLELLVREDQVLSHAATLSELEAIFRRSIGSARVREGRFALQRTSSAADDLSHQVLGPPLPGESLPPLERLVRNRLRPGAELLWQTEDGEPVLGAWRVGRGRSALFSSAIRPGWAPAWMDRFGSGEPRAFGPLLRWLARSDGTAVSPRLEIDGRRFVVSGLPADLPRELFLVLAAPGRETLRVVLGPWLAPSGVAEPRRRVGHVPQARPGSDSGSDSGSGSPSDPWDPIPLEVTALLEGGPEPMFLRVVRAPALEFQAPGPEAEAVLARFGSNRDAAEEGEPTSGSKGAGRSHPAAPWTLALGLLTLFFGVLERRRRAQEGGLSSPTAQRAGA